MKRGKFRNAELKKRIYLPMLIVMAAWLMVSGVWAYLTDDEKAGNLFTIGQVTGLLTEPSWDKETDLGHEPGKDLVPNQTVAKDPVITNTGENDAYVFLRVHVPVRELTLLNEDGSKQDYKTVTEVFSFLHGDAGSYEDGFDLYDPDTNPDGMWIEIPSQESRGVKDRDTSVYVFGYRVPLKKNETTDALFDAVRIANYVEGEITDKDKFQIVVEAYMIQSNYVGDIDTAAIAVANQRADDIAASSAQKARSLVAASSTGTSLPDTEKARTALTSLFETYAAQNAHTVYSACVLGPENEAIREDGKIEEPEHVERTGYTFAGWYTEKAVSGGPVGNALTFADQTAMKKASKYKISFPYDTTTSAEGIAYPAYVPYSYTVHFNGGDDATGTMEDMAFVYDEEKNLTPNAFAKAGYEFVGWSLTENGGVNLADEALVKNLLDEVDTENFKSGTVIQLYAVWKSNYIQITYYADGLKKGSGAFADGTTENTLIVQNTDSGITRLSGTYQEPTPNSDTVTFAGWYSDIFCRDENAVNVDTTTGIPKDVTIAGDVKLYAKWN